MAPDRLSALDASFLDVETPTAHMHVGWAAVFDPPAGRPAPRFDELRDHIARRLPRAPRYRQILRSLPLGLGTPAWVDDQSFDLGRHVQRARSRQLDAVVDRCMSEPLPRDRPLWQLWIADRLADGRIGVVGKAHHCMVDGLAAVELASLLLDPDPDARDPEPDEWTPSPPPPAHELAAAALGDLIPDGIGFARLAASAASSPRRAIEAGARARRAAMALLDAARPAPANLRLNRPISPLRRLGLLRRSLDDLLRVKTAFGVKLNDVLLAAAAGGVRRFLKDRGDGALRLKTMVPVTARSAAEAAELGNAISFIFVDLPCDEPDPARRLAEVHAATMARKRAGEPQGANDVMRSLALAPSPLRTLASRLVASPRTFNLVVSNIPGPREPLYMRGCRLAEAYPVVPIADRHALSIGVTTLGDSAFFGLYADRKSLPDVDALAEAIDASVDELAAVADEPPIAERLVGPAA
jgi:diacylglycerol O-acyltransferase / wax synthase